MPFSSQGEALVPVSASSSGSLPEENDPYQDGHPATHCLSKYFSTLPREKGDLPVLRSLEPNGVGLVCGSDRSETGGGSC